ncbi:MAG: ATP-binding cassette domain-containing protein [Clostridia bacterium]|nr:ATP-binding cassette domain-containing protein [Clostridia bacterium]
MADIIEVNNLTKDYGKGRGIFDFSFSVKEGEVFGLVGTNGSGKTTTIRHMMGFLKGDTGTVKIKGMDAWQKSAEIKKLIGYVPGQIDFPDVGSGTSFLKIQAELLGLKDFSYMNSLIDRLKIDITAPLRRMSKGMKQKMALVAAFMAQPQIYLLDEPSTGLDPLMRDTMIEIILEQKAQGKTVFMSSHVFKELEDTCDSVMFIHDGKIINTVSRNQFSEDPHETYKITFASGADFKKYSSAAEGALLAADEEKRTVTVNIAEKRINEFLKDLSAFKIAGLSHEKYSLEKYYMEKIENSEVK